MKLLTTLITCTLLTSIVVQAQDHSWRVRDTYYRIDPDGAWYRSNDKAATWEQILPPVNKQQVAVDVRQTEKGIVATPNPCIGRLTLKGDFLKKGLSQLDVIALDGSVTRLRVEGAYVNENEASIDLTPFAAGAYTIVLTAHHETAFVSIIRK